jgi:hypothetical protein
MVARPGNCVYASEADIARGLNGSSGMTRR